MKTTSPNRTWAEINLDNIAHNYKEFLRITGTVKVMCVIKANACEHGSVAVAKRLEKEGCDTFAVATLDEGLELRRAGIASLILLLNHISFERVGEALENELTMTVYSIEMAKCISGTANKPAKIHVKIDTGMNRVGLDFSEAAKIVKNISVLPNIEIEGVYTHFSCADECETTFTDLQVYCFDKVCAEIENAGVPIKIKHAANSAAAIMYPQTHYDMVRVGISLYGCYPSDEVDKTRVNLKPVKQLKTQIIRIHETEPGAAVSYGRKFITERKSILATIPVGYADGVSRVLSGKLMVLINGQAAPVVGRICMDQCIADITDITGEVNIFDEVVIYGEQKGAVITVEQVASQMGTINYETLCTTSRRIPRYYIENGEITSEVHYL